MRGEQRHGGDYSLVFVGPQTLSGQVHLAGTECAAFPRASRRAVGSYCEENMEMFWC